MTIAIWPLLAALASGPSQQTVPLGKPVEKIECQAAPGQSYALYLPSTYTSEKKWPILYAFDPARRGMIPVGLFRESAERHGFIIASSNNFRSDQPTPDEALAAQAAIWNDTHSRLSIDTRRIYSTGFSGGARISWMFEYRTEGYPFAGIIGVGAGLPGQKIPKAWDPSHMSFYGMAGERDFNYYEMLQVDEMLAEKGVPHRFTSFEGGHQWPPQQLCNQALDWMQLQAVKRGLAEPDQDFLDGYLQSQLQQAAEARQGGHPVEAYQILRSLSEDFRGIRETSQIEERLSHLKSSPELSRRLKKRRKERKKAEQHQQKAVSVLDWIRSAERGNLPNLREVMFEMQLAKLLKQAAGEDREESLAAWRVLETVFVQTVFYMPREFKGRDDFERAELCLHIATCIKPQNARAWYSLARVQAQSGLSGSALESLGKALDFGFNNLEFLQGDEELAPLRDKPEFEKLLERLRQKGSGS